MTSRSAPCVVLAAVLASTAAACSNATYSCASNGRCVVSLSGDGATTEVDDNVEVVLVKANGYTAYLSVAGRSVSCADGDSVEVSGIGVTCDSVGDAEIDLTLELDRR